MKPKLNKFLEKIDNVGSIQASITKRKRENTKINKIRNFKDILQ